MADKIFGTDFTDETNPSGTETISINNGSILKDVVIKALLALVPHNQSAKSAPVAADEVAIIDSESLNILKKAALSNLLGFMSHTPGGRLTLTSGVPVTSADVTGATTVYYTPYIHNKIRLWDGSGWEIITFSEVSLALGTVTSGLPYDVFGYLSAGALAIEKLAWTNGTTRATAISYQDGSLCKTGDKTRLYLGTFYTTSTTTTEDSGGGVTSQVGGKRFLWNMYNRVERFASVIDTTDSWSYVTNTIRQANGAAGNKVEYVCGVNEGVIVADVRGTAFIKNATNGAKTGVGIDSTTAFSGLVQGSFNNNTNAVDVPIGGSYRGMPGLGYHYIAWLERGGDTTCAFSGDNGGDRQSGLTACCFS